MQVPLLHASFSPFCYTIGVDNKGILKSKSILKGISTCFCLESAFKRLLISLMQKQWTQLETNITDKLINNLKKWLKSFKRLKIKSTKQGVHNYMQNNISQSSQLSLCKHLILRSQLLKWLKTQKLKECGNTNGNFFIDKEA